MPNAEVAVVIYVANDSRRPLKDSKKFKKSQISNRAGRTPETLVMPNAEVAVVIYVANDSRRPLKDSKKN